MLARKKPVTIECFKWTGGPDQTEDPEWAVEAIKRGNMYFISDMSGEVHMIIKTLEGKIVADRGDYIIKGVHGELYPCKPDIFAETYDIVGGNE